MLKEPNRLITQDGRIAALEAELAAAKQDKERLTLKATRDLPMSLNLVRLYSDEVWRLVGSGLMNSRSKLADITLDARGFLADLSERPLAAGAPEGTTETDSAGAIPLCEDCPPVGYPTDKTRCAECPLRAPEGTEEREP